jgi:hypothetical protein
MTNTREKPHKGSNYLFWLMISEVADHHGKKDVTQQSGSHHGDQKGERREK